MQPTFLDMTEINELVDLTSERLFEKFTTDEILKPLRIDAVWNGRLRRALGRSFNHYTKIDLSSYYWPYMKIAERKDTIIHEVCHQYQNILYKGSANHGKEWQGLAIYAGCTPKASSKNVELPEEMKRRNHVKIACYCEDNCWVKKSQVKAVLAGRYDIQCGKCECMLNVHKKIK